jgi:hypothetical protein
MARNLLEASLRSIDIGEHAANAAGPLSSN